MKRLVVALMAFVFLMSAVFVLPACAETITQDGLVVTLTTDKESYDSMNAVNARLTITNTNSYAVNNVSAEITAPDGYVLRGDAEEEHGTLRAGRSRTQEAAVYRADYAPKLPKTGDGSHFVLWVVLFILCVAGVCAFAHNPHAKRFLSLLLCTAILAPYALRAVPARAETVESTIAVSKSVKVAGKDVTLMGTVNYETVVARDLKIRTIEETAVSDFSYTVENDEVTITEYTGNNSEVVVPAFIDDYPVARISDRAFYNNLNLGSIIIQDGIVSIGESAFAYCYALKSINLPESLQVIGRKAFLDCEAIKEIDIPESVISIGDQAFSNCKSLKSVTIPEGIIVIGGSTFKNCESLASVNIGGSIEHIGPSAFEKCTSLIKIDLPQSVKIIGKKAFLGCKQLSEVNLSEGLLEIQDEAFRGCTSLKNISVPEGATKIAYHAFYGCTSLLGATIPVSVSDIGLQVFLYCDNLTIYGFNATTAQDYAKQYGIPFVDLATVPTVRDYRINGYSDQVTVRIGETLSFTGSVIASSNTKISQFQMYVYDTSEEPLGSVGEEYYHQTVLETSSLSFMYSLSDVPSMVVGDAFGESNYRMTAGNSYAVMLCAMDSNGNGFEDADANTPGYQGPFILVHVEASLDNCDHSSGNHNTTKDSDSVTRYRLNPDDESSHPQGHQIGDIYTRYCADCGKPIQTNILIWAGLEDHEIVNGVCQKCGYVEIPKEPASIVGFALDEDSVTFGNDVHVKSGMAYGGDYYLRKVQISVFTDDTGAHGYYSDVSKEFANGEATSYDLSKLGAIAINGRFTCEAHKTEEAFPAGDAMVMVFVSVYNEDGTAGDNTFGADAADTVTVVKAKNAPTLIMEKIDVNIYYTQFNCSVSSGNEDIVGYGFREKEAGATTWETDLYESCNGFAPNMTVSYPVPLNPDTIRVFEFYVKTSTDEFSKQIQLNVPALEDVFAVSASHTGGATLTFAGRIDKLVSGEESILKYGFEFDEDGTVTTQEVGSTATSVYPIQFTFDKAVDKGKTVKYRAYAQSIIGTVYSDWIEIVDTICSHEAYTDVYNANIPIRYTDNNDGKTHTWQSGYDRICDTCHANLGVVYGEENTADHDYTNGDVCPCGYDRSNCQHTPSEIKTYNRHLFAPLNEKQHETIAIVWDMVCSKCGSTYSVIDTEGDDNNKLHVQENHAWENGKCVSEGCGYECLHPEKQADGSDNYQDKYLGTISLTDNGDGVTHHHVYNVKRTCLLCKHSWTVTIDDPAEKHTIQYLDKAGEYKHDANEHWLEVPEGCSCGYRTGKTEIRNKEEHKPQVTSTDYRYDPDGDFHQIWKIEMYSDCVCGLQYEDQSAYMGFSGHYDRDSDGKCDACKMLLRQSVANPDSFYENPIMTYIYDKADVSQEFLDQLECKTSNIAYQNADYYYGGIQHGPMNNVEAMLSILIEHGILPQMDENTSRNDYVWELKIAKEYLKILNEQGCLFTALSNSIFEEFRGREEDFYSTFGYPMYVEGHLNHDAVLVDFFCDYVGVVAWAFNMKLVDEHSDWYNSGLLAYALKLLGRDEVNAGDVINSIKNIEPDKGENDARCNAWLEFCKKHGVQCKIEDLREERISIDRVKTIIEEGGNLIFGFEKGLQLRDENGVNVCTVGGGHAVTVTGVYQNNQEWYVVVSSWGSPYLISWNDIVTNNPKLVGRYVVSY